MGDRFAILDTLPIFDGKYGVAQTELEDWNELYD